MTTEADRFEEFIATGLGVTEECCRMAKMIEDFEHPLTPKMKEALVKFLRYTGKYTELTMTMFEKMRNNNAGIA